MQSISAAQIRAARAYLGWTQEKLAEATGLSAKTIYNLELGNISPRSETNNVVFQVLRDKGIEFLESGGIRPRLDEFKVFEGPDSCEIFFDDMLQTIKKKNGEICIVVRSHNMLAEICGAAPRGDVEWIGQLSNAAPVKCILSEVPAASLFPPSFQFRINPNKNRESVANFVYGDRYAMAVAEGNSFKFIIIQSMIVAQDHRLSFLELWERAVPVLIQTSPLPQRTTERVRA
jgi:transcriptional regulator with XRE-family HTH domain